MVVTPEKTVLEQPSDFVALPLEDGEIGIGENHSPLVGRLGFGEMRLRVGDQVQQYYVDGGFVQVVNNTVTVLTNQALPADTLDAAAAQQQLQAAFQRPANTPALLEIRDRLVRQARGQFLVARRTPACLAGVSGDGALGAGLPTPPKPPTEGLPPEAGHGTCRRKTDSVLHVPTPASGAQNALPQRQSR